MTDLKPREREILALLAKGHNLKSAATEMSVSYWTVRDHLETARLRLGARTTAQAVAIVAAAPPDRSRGGPMLSEAKERR